MARPDKAAVVEEVRERLSSSTATVLTEYRGLTVGELAQLRAQLRGSDASYVVVKNTLTRIAAREAGLEVPDELLVGPTAVTFCAGDPVAVAKVLRAFSRDHPELVVKGSVLDGRPLDAAETLRLADLESREELLSRLAGMFTAIVAQPARLAQANLSKAARLFAALQERLPAEPAAPAAESAAPAADAGSGDAEATAPDSTESPSPAPDTTTADTTTADATTADATTADATDQE